jgi:hypothetical protein
VTVVNPNESAFDASATPSSAGGTPSTGPGSTAYSGGGGPDFSGKIPFRVTARLSESYNDNIYVKPTKVADYITRMSIAGEFRTGDRVAVDGNFLDILYEPSLHLFARHSNLDGVDQFGHFFYQHRFSKLALSIAQDYSRTQSTNASIGNLVESDVYTTVAKASYAYSSKVDVVAVARQVLTDYSDPSYTNSNEWTGTVYGMYHLDPKLSFGLGPVVGYLEPERSVNQTYEQLLARATYAITNRVSVEADVGVEDRQYLSSTQPDKISPIFEASAVYLPFPSTAITLSGSSRYVPAYSLAGQEYLATGVNMTVSQRILQEFHIDCGAGYENDQYDSITSSASGPDRRDNFFYIRPYARWNPNGWLQISVFDRYEEDDSNLAVYAYEANEVGFTVSAKY